MWQEHHLAVGEGTNQDSGQETILSKEQEVLLVKCGDDALTILLDDFRLDDQRYPILAGRFPCLQSEHGETSRKTGDTTEDRFEGLRVVMGDEVLEDLDGGDPRLPLVRYPRLSTNTHDHLIVVHAVNEVLERVGVHFRVGVNLRGRSEMPIRVEFAERGLPSDRLRRSQE